MKLNLNSNTFIENKAINGGALYIKDNTDISKNYNDFNITINNNSFNKNEVEDFGGAIFIFMEFDDKYNIQFENNTLLLNTAGIMGGGLYSHNLNLNTLFQKNIFVNNTVNSYINNYTSRPYYITIDTNFTNNKKSIITGEYLPLKFSLYDEYDNIIFDITKYYSSLILKATLNINDNNNDDDDYDEDDDDDDDVSKKYHLIGNIGSFSNGILYNIYFY